MKKLIPFAAVALLSLAALEARAANVYVSPSGGGDGSIASPTDLQTALDMASASAADDTLFLQKGTYPAAATFAFAATGSDTSSLRVRGGWDAAFTYQAQDPALTVLDGLGARRVLRVAADGAAVDVTVTLESLTVRNGRTSEHAAPPGDTGSGAGISAVNAGGARLRIVLEWCDVLDNETAHPASQGGGIYLTCEARLRHVNVRRNLTRHRGGGLLATHAPPYTQALAPTVEHSMFWANRAYDGATADYAGSHVATDAAPVFRNCVFSGLGAAPGGSGVLSHDGGNPAFEACVFSVNVANGSGGAIRFEDGGGGISGCLFLGNRAGEGGDGAGGALALDDASPASPRAVAVVNSTFVGNLTAGSGGRGGAIHSRAVALAVANSIFWDNGTAADKGGDYALLSETGTATIHHSDVQGGAGSGFTGGDNIDAAPSAAPWDYPYALPAGSPCVDAGDNAAVPAALIADFEGHPRIFGGNDPQARVVDMGWDEYYDGELSVAAPAANSTWLRDAAAKEIAWTCVNIPGSVRLSLWRGSPAAGGVEAVEIAAAVPCAGQSHAWTLPADIPLGDYALVAASLEMPALVAWSEFSIRLLRLTFPNGGQGLVQGSTYRVTWKSGNLPGALIRVQLYGGATLLRMLAPGAPNTGSFAWKVPYAVAPGGAYRIRLSPQTLYVAEDWSDASFRVVPALSLGAPNGGERVKRGTTCRIAWTYRNNPGGRVRLDLYRNGALDRTIAGAAPIGAAGKGSYAWRVPATLAPGAGYTVRVGSATYPNCFDFSNREFTVTR